MRLERTQVRKKVPEQDPTYQAERKKYSQFGLDRNVLGRVSLGIYERMLRDTQFAAGRIESKTAERDSLPETEARKRATLEKEIQGSQQFIEQETTEAGRFLREDFQEFFRNVDELMFEARIYHEQVPKVVEAVRYMLADQEVQAELHRYRGEELSQLTPFDLWTMIANKEISDDSLYRMAKRHDERLRLQEAELAQMVEQIKVDFKQAVTQAVEEGWLPMTAAQSLFRIDQVVVNIKDILLDMRVDALGESGSHGRIGVSSFHLQPQLTAKLRATLFHEFLHELSGKSISVETKTFTEGFEIHEVRYAKSGVSLRPETAEYQANKWLNEAITEWLALRLSGYAGDEAKTVYRGSFAYVSERQELDRLMSLGLEEGVITRAFFENFSSDQAPGELGKEYVALVGRIKALEGVNGFLSLENAHMLREAEQFLRQGGFRPAANLPMNAVLPPGSRIFRVHLQMGNAKEVRKESDLVYVAQPVEAGSIRISAEEMWDRKKIVLNSLPYNFGANKVHFEVTEQMAA